MFKFISSFLVAWNNRRLKSEMVRKQVAVLTKLAEIETIMLSNEGVVEKASKAAMVGLEEKALKFDFKIFNSEAEARIACESLESNIKDGCVVRFPIKNENS